MSILFDPSKFFDSSTILFILIPDKNIYLSNDTKKKKKGRRGERKRRGITSNEKDGSTRRTSRYLLYKRKGREDEGKLKSMVTETTFDISWRYH